MTIDRSDILLACARAAHEVNRAYCIAIGDVSQASWDDAPMWQKTSAVQGVDVALNGATPEEQHISWLAEKTSAGWKYGPIKDPEKKEHPCMVPYVDLPAAQRQKDMLFVGTVRIVAASLGGKVTYPSVPAREATDSLPSMPAFPERTVDWSKESAGLR